MPRKGLTTTSVVVAAGDLADTDGLSAVTLGRLGARLGVRVPSLYKHVDGIGDLFRRLAETATLELAEVLRAAASGRSGRDALNASCHAYRDFALTKPGRYDSIQHPVDTTADLVEARTTVWRAGAETLRGYHIDKDQLIIMLRLVRSALHGFVCLERGQAFRVEVPLELTFEQLIAMLDSTLTRRST